MSNNELTALVNELIALCQRNDLLPTNSEELADELQDLASNEIYISKSELDYFVN
jgi:hypothetical protein